MSPDFQVGIIGAGFAGIIAALRLQQSGRNSFVIFERAEDVGGTWRDNIYPGCACDVPSHLYSIATEPNPNWSRMYSPQAEIWEYLRNVVRKNQLEKHLRYHSDIVRCEFVEKEGWWKVIDQQGRATTVRMLIAGLGPLNRAKLPEIKGLDSFQGKVQHSSQWDQNYSLKGKRVAVIGTGASAVQIVPTIAPEVERLVVFQRTPAWVGDRFDFTIPKSLRGFMQKFPRGHAAIRKGLYALLEWRGKMFVGNARIHNLFVKLSLQKLRREVRDPEVRRKLTPNYTMGCKRILVSDDYWPAFNRANVYLETAAIAEVTRNGIRTVEGKEHEVDAIVLATGFEVADGTSFTMKIIGRNGRELFEGWRCESMEAYKGGIISGFPNFAYLLGPNAGLGHNSVLLVMEMQMNYVIDYLALLERKGEKAALDLQPQVQRAYNDELQRLMGNTVWASGCKSWYANAQGKITALYPRLLEQFRRENERVEAREYEVVG